MINRDAGLSSGSERLRTSPIPRDSWGSFVEAALAVRAARSNANSRRLSLLRSCGSRPKEHQIPRQRLRKKAARDRISGGAKFS
jgi:hypothetical protein